MTPLSHAEQKQLLYAKSNLPLSLRAVIKHPLFLFLLFASYGPSINIIGQLRFTEIAILIIGSIYIRDIVKASRRNHVFFAVMFVFTGLCYVCFDLINHGITQITLKRTASYLLLGTEFVIIAWLISMNRNRILAALLGFCCSFLIVYTFGINIPNNNFHTVPWLVGMGKAVTLLALIAMACLPRLRHFFITLMIFLIIFHLMMGSRHLFVITLLTFLLFIVSEFIGHKTAQKFHFRQYGLLVILFGCFLSLVSITYISLTALNVIPQNIVDKMERQIYSPYGLIVTARPDVAAAVLGIAKKPLIGYGSSTLDDKIYYDYSIFYSGGENELLMNILNNKGNFESTPSHSHLFGAWVDAGFLASIAWIFVVIFSLQLLMSTSFYRNVLTPLTLFITLTMLWDVIFSPGPNRIETGLFLTFLFFARYRMQFHKT
jgi:hypothetical protein